MSLHSVRSHIALTPVENCEHPDDVLPRGIKENSQPFSVKANNSVPIKVHMKKMDLLQGIEIENSVKPDILLEKQYLERQIIDMELAHSKIKRSDKETMHISGTQTELAVIDLELGNKISEQEVIDLELGNKISEQEVIYLDDRISAQEAIDLDYRTVQPELTPIDGLGVITEATVKNVLKIRRQKDLLSYSDVIFDNCDSLDTITNVFADCENKNEIEKDKDTSETVEGGGEKHNRNSRSFFDNETEIAGEDNKKHTLLDFDEKNDYIGKVSNHRSSSYTGKIYNHGSNSNNYRDNIYNYEGYSTEDSGNTQFGHETVIRTGEPLVFLKQVSLTSGIIPACGSKRSSVSYDTFVTSANSLHEVPSLSQENIPESLTKVEEEGRTLSSMESKTQEVTYSCNTNIIYKKNVENSGQKCVNNEDKITKKYEDVCALDNPLDIFHSDKIKSTYEPVDDCRDGTTFEDVNNDSKTNEKISQNKHSNGDLISEIGDFNKANSGNSNSDADKQDIQKHVSANNVLTYYSRKQTESIDTLEVSSQGDNVSADSKSISSTEYFYSYSHTNTSLKHDDPVKCANRNDSTCDFNEKTVNDKKHSEVITDAHFIDSLKSLPSDEKDKESHVVNNIGIETEHDRNNVYLTELSHPEISSDFKDNQSYSIENYVVQEDTYEKTADASLPVLHQQKISKTDFNNDLNKIRHSKRMMNSSKPVSRVLSRKSVSKKRNRYEAIAEMKAIDRLLIGPYTESLSQKTQSPNSSIHKSSTKSNSSTIQKHKVNDYDELNEISKTTLEKSNHIHFSRTNNVTSQNNAVKSTDRALSVKKDTGVYVHNKRNVNTDKKSKGRTLEQEHNNEDGNNMGIKEFSLSDRNIERETSTVTDYLHDATSMAILSSSGEQTSLHMCKRETVVNVEEEHVTESETTLQKNEEITMENNKIELVEVEASLPNSQKNVQQTVLLDNSNGMLESSLQKSMEEPQQATLTYNQKKVHEIDLPVRNKQDALHNNQNELQIIGLPGNQKEVWKTAAQNSTKEIQQIEISNVSVTVEKRKEPHQDKKRNKHEMKNKHMLRELNHDQNMKGSSQKCIHKNAKYELSHKNMTDIAVDSKNIFISKAQEKYEMLEPALEKSKHSSEPKDFELETQQASVVTQDETPAVETQSNYIAGQVTINDFLHKYKENNFSSNSNQTTLPINSMEPSLPESYFANGIGKLHERPTRKSVSINSLTVPGLQPNSFPKDTPLDEDDISMYSRRDSTRYSFDSVSRKSVDYRIRNTAMVVLPTVDEKPKSILTNDESFIKNAIPFLPKNLAVVCLILNIIIPGSGTTLSGLSILFCGQPRLSNKEDQILITLCVNCMVGLAQLFTVTFLLVGWFWSVRWGIEMVLLSVQYEKEMKEQRLHELQSLTLNALGSPKHPAIFET